MTLHRASCRQELRYGIVYKQRVTVQEGALTSYRAQVKYTYRSKLTLSGSGWAEAPEAADSRRVMRSLQAAPKRYRVPRIQVKGLKYN
jgi:hypothetical protein